MNWDGYNMLWFLAILTVIFVLVYEARDRKRNPEIWRCIEENQRRESGRRDVEATTKSAAKQEKNRPDVARRFYEEYQGALKRIPRSEWMLLTTREKSNIFRRRERLKSDFHGLPYKTKQLIIRKYSIDTSFPESN
jgi:hypothetical protein